uniref:Macaca fascicularis brain cDNA clone: QccE-16707, similar to human TBC1 domain family, member 8 (with GRAM domain)(TBC1D8), mRNA, RefSeq: NM_007063.2 n=1 Tax=Macaca fascicularis TaxID=9541 RepID=I7GKC9_MACFA|nr:unnamed protein product [Macaca fascicularis]
MSSGFSKKFTNDCSVRSEAKICSRETVQSACASSGNAWESWGVFPVSAKTESSGEGAEACSSSPHSWEQLPELLLRCPTSPICSSSVVTVAMAWYKSFSSGSSWNILYRVLQNWINSL